MKSTLILLSSSTLFGAFAFAGEVITPSDAPAPADGFAKARRPISNPTLFDLALPTTNIHPIYIHHELPGSINTALGNIPLGGEVDVFALQAEFALNDRFSFVATKDGYVEMNPDSTLGSTDGFANIGAGGKYAFLLDPAAGRALSGTATFEMPVGDDDVFQGEGDGAVNLILSGLQLVDNWQFAGAVGTQIPFSHEQATSGFVSVHASYEISQWFIPLVELNWFHVFDAGDGGALFPPVSQITEFEGNDFFNLGASQAHENRDLVTAALGFRTRFSETVNMGFAYEMPLTNDEDSLWDNRFTVDLVWSF